MSVYVTESIRFHGICHAVCVCVCVRVVYQAGAEALDQAKLAFIRKNLSMSLHVCTESIRHYSLAVEQGGYDLGQPSRDFLARIQNDMKSLQQHNQPGFHSGQKNSQISNLSIGEHTDRERGQNKGSDRDWEQQRQEQQRLQQQRQLKGIDMETRVIDTTFRFSPFSTAAGFVGQDLSVEREDARFTDVPDILLLY